MKVLLRRNVQKLGKIGDLVDVKPGYARNYLIPQGLAIHPTPSNIKAVEAEKERYLAEMAAKRAELEARAAQLQGKEITIAVRANPEGHLYGSVGPAQIVARLAEENIFIQADEVKLDKPIRQLDKYEVTARFAEDVTAVFTVWVVPIHEEGDQQQSGETQATEIETSDQAEDSPQTETGSE